MKQLVRMPVRSSRIAEHDRQQEAAEAAGEADDAGDHADVVRVLVGDVLEHRRLAERPGDAHDEHQRGEHPGVQADVEGLRAVDGRDGHVGLRVGQDEQADPATPTAPTR